MKALDILTYVVKPLDAMWWWFGVHVALQVDVVAFLDIGRVKGSAESRDGRRRVCKERRVRKLGMRSNELQALAPTGSVGLAYEMNEPF